MRSPMFFVSRSKQRGHGYRGAVVSAHQNFMLILSCQQATLGDMLGHRYSMLGFRQKDWLIEWKEQKAVLLIIVLLPVYVHPLSSLCHTFLHTLKSLGTPTVCFKGKFSISWRLEKCHVYINQITLPRPTVHSSARGHSTIYLVHKHLVYEP